MTHSEILRGDVWWVSLDPTQGAEIKKTRPCLVVSHDTLNKHRRTVIVVPISSSAKPHPPITVSVTCQGQPAVAITDQIRAVAKHRMKSRIESVSGDDIKSVEDAVSTVLCLV